MKLSQFDFDLPQDLIAQEPCRPRDSARMLLVKPDDMEDLGVTDLTHILRPGDLMVVNDTRVIPARLSGHRGNAKVEVTLLKEIGPGQWTAFARPGRRLREGDRVDFAPEFYAILEDKLDGGEVSLRFNSTGENFLKDLQRYGSAPLPPYIKRPTGGLAQDLNDYQTPFAKRDGAVAAPTASLHFTKRLLDKLSILGIKQTTVTLHVGAGTFLPVKTESIKDHKMHSEWGEVTEDAVNAIAETKASGGRVIAIGTTPLR
ncbi:MAG: S-adenosylmethionine:tRNA ribosyltransferase-isomerase, partial [Rhodospirillales bacterium]